MRLTKWIQNIGLIVPHHLREKTDAIFVGSEYDESSLSDEGITILAEDFTHTRNALRRIRYGINLLRETDQKALIPQPAQQAFERVQHFLNQCNEQYFKDLKPIPSKATKRRFIAGTYLAEGSIQYDTHHTLWQKLCSDAGLGVIPLIVAESDFPFMNILPSKEGEKGMVSSYYLDRLHPDQLESLFLHEIQHIVERKRFKEGDQSLGVPGYTDDMQHNHAMEYRADDNGASDARLAMGSIQRAMIGDSRSRQLAHFKKLLQNVVKHNIRQALIPEIQEKFDAPLSENPAVTAIREAQKDVEDAFDRYSLTHPSKHDRVLRSWQHFHRHNAGSDSRDHER